MFYLNGFGTNDTTIDNIDVGWNNANADGSFVGLRSADFTSNPGGFILRAKNPNASATLEGKADGTLTWSGTYNGINLASQKYITSDNYGGNWVQIVKDKALLNSTNSAGAYGWLNGYTKSYKVLLGAYPASTEKIYLMSFTKDNVTSQTNASNKSLTWDASNGYLLNGGSIEANGSIISRGDHGVSPSSGGLTITGGRQNYAIQIQTDRVTKGTAPSDILYNGIEFYGNTMTKYQNRLGIIEHSVDTSNTSKIIMSAYGCSAAETTTNCAISCNTDSSGNVWTSAPTPAQTDSSTKIATTAYVKACVPKSIGDANTPVYTNANGVITSTGKSFANYVALTGAQTISGTKTFSGTSTFSGQVILTRNTDAAGTANNGPALIIGGAATVAHIEIDNNAILAKSNGTTLTTLYLQDGNATVYINTTTLAPNVTNTLTLGASGKVWKQLFAGTTTISTSDRRMKEDIEDIPDEVLDAWEEVNFKQFKFKDAVEEKGSENARIHIGLIAQDIKETFEKHGLDAFKYGLLCWDEWDEHEDPKDDTSPIIAHKDQYALRYEEALCLEAAYQRRRLDRLEEYLKLK